MKTSITTSFALLFGILLASLTASNAVAQQLQCGAEAEEVDGVCVGTVHVQCVEGMDRPLTPFFFTGTEVSECVAVTSQTSQDGVSPSCDLVYPRQGTDFTREFVLYEHDGDVEGEGLCLIPCTGTGKDRGEDSTGKPTDACACPTGYGNFRGGTITEDDDFCAVPRSCANNLVANAHNDGCECPEEFGSDTPPFDNGTPADESDDFCEADADCRGDQVQRMGMMCGCPDGMEEQNNGTPTDASDDFCEASAMCRRDQVQRMGMMCRCPDGMEEQNNGTPTDASDDFCEASAMCRRDQVQRMGMMCRCPDGMEEQDNGTDSDPSDDFCAVSVSCATDLFQTMDGGCACENTALTSFRNNTPDDLTDDFCDAPAGCLNGTRNDMNVCECTDSMYPDLFDNGTDSDLSDDFCAAPLACENGEPNDMNNGCECTDSMHPQLFDRGDTAPENDFCAAACRDDQVQSGGVTCACPAGEQEFNNASGVVECAAPVACSGGEVRAPVNACICPAGNMLVGSECQPIPQSDDGDPIIRYAAPAAIVGMLVVANIYSQGSYELIPAFDVSGENENFTWSSGVRSESNDGRFSSFVSAAHSSYESGVIIESGGKYGADLFDMQYRSKESNERLEYEFQLSSPFAFGLWEVSPSAEAEFEYESESRTWDSASSLDIAAAWSAHRWRIKAGSSFAFDGASHQAVKFEAEKRF